MVGALRSHRNGWTLVELTIVISLISILSAVAVVGYRNAITRSREAVLKEDLFRMRDAIDQYHADTGDYPAALDALVTAGYLRAIPVDPFTNSAESWVVEQPGFDAANPFAAGVFDVRSGYEGAAIDGTQYSEW